MIFLHTSYYLWLWKAFISGDVKFHLTSFARDSKVAPFVHLDARVDIARCELGSYSYISRGTTMVQTNVGRYCSIGPECRIGMGSHPTNLMSTSPIFFSTSNKIGVSLVEEASYNEFETIEIDNDVWIGSRVMIMGGCHIGNGAVVAAGSVVTKDVKPFSIVGGVPAKEISMRFDDSFITLLESSKWWELDHNQLRDDFNLQRGDKTEWSQSVSAKVCMSLIDKKGVEDE